MADEHRCVAWRRWDAAAVAAAEAEAAEEAVAVWWRYRTHPESGD